MAPTVAQPACQEQLIEAAKLVAKSVEGIVAAAQSACGDDNVLQDLGSAATAVTRALNDLLQHIKKAAGPTKVQYNSLSLSLSLSHSLSLNVPLLFLEKNCKQNFPRKLIWSIKSFFSFVVL